MPRTLTTPEPQPSATIATIEQATITQVFNADGTINLDATTYSYVVNTRDTNGVISSKSRVMVHADWQNPLKALLKNVISQTLAEAEDNGDIGAGSDTDDLA